MHKPAHAIEIFLQPGEFHFDGKETRIRTLLGSCVAITMWHPEKRIGGMCHFMLPSRTVRPAGELDGRYADEAIELFLREIRMQGTRPGEYQVKLFGGGNMFDVPTRCRQEDDCNNVACRNVMAARRLLQAQKLVVAAEHVGMQGHRNVMFDIWSGKVWMRYVDKAVPQMKVSDLEENQCINS